ncbi:TPA: hypothetical protein N0F65_011519 [Lagenidium giganteum]|uniref:Uncharacterized protein n=1 Tax=Lagenidium giganteum TaxID=4803 RepID=A0AAV2Z8D9_9STRA|nr:TPA: hypothetical protein N0F65_011519 [Lagenidium giganteum]
MMADWTGKKYSMLLICKSNPSRSADTDAENHRLRNGVDRTVWKDAQELMNEHGVQIYANRAASWN